MNELISEFFDDFIRRIIPGLVASFLFVNRFLPGVNNLPSQSLIAVFLTLLVVAWLLGLTLDIVTTTLGWLLLKYVIRFKFSNGETPLERLLPGVPFEAHWVKKTAEAFTEQIIPDPKTRGQLLYFAHRQCRKNDAEKVMCRNLSLTFSLALIPPLQPQFSVSPMFCNIHWQWWYSALAAVIFFAGWLWSICTTWYERHPNTTSEKPTSDQTNTAAPTPPK